MLSVTRSKYASPLLALLAVGVLAMMMYVFLLSVAFYGSAERDVRIGHYKAEVTKLEKKVEELELSANGRHLLEQGHHDTMREVLSRAEQEMKDAKDSHKQEKQKLEGESELWKLEVELERAKYNRDIADLQVKIDFMKQWQIHQGAFVTLVTPSFWKPGLVLVQTARNAGVTLPFVVMVVDPSGLPFGHPNYTALPIEAEQAFKRLQANIRYIEQVPVPAHAMFENPRWAIAWNKLRAFEFTEYDKLVFLDSDMMVLQDVTEMLSFPDFSAAPGHEIPCETHHGVSGGAFVFAPNATVYQQLLAFAETDPGDHWRQAEQELLAFFYPSFYKNRLHLISGLYNMSMRSCQCLKPIVLADHVKIIHFYSGEKPWDNSKEEWEEIKNNGSHPACVADLSLKWYNTLEFSLRQV